MKILFDVGVPKRLRPHLAPHEVLRAQEAGLAPLANGELLRAAEKEFDVLLTTDTNLNYQQNLPGFDIAVIVLRAFRASEKLLLPLMPKVLAALESIRPGECVYLYADDALERKDERKGKPKN